MEKDLIEKYKSLFIPGIKLNEFFYNEAIRPILDEYFPSLPYSASLAGYGSDVLGYDNPVSVDHDWGPRLQLFLTLEDYEAYREEIHKCLCEHLPPEFRGFSVNFSKPDLSDGGTIAMEPVNHGPVNHNIKIFTLKSFFKTYLGVDPFEEISPVTWLTFTEQSLLEVTGGKVYHDGLGELNKLRDKFSCYPEDIWLYKMACQWQRISQEEPFMGRCGDAGDEAGSHIIAARLVRDMMKLCFIMEKKYAPYNKWFGSAFKKLKIAEKLLPVLNNILKGPGWQEREKYLCEAFVIIGEMHNDPGITEHIEVKISNFFERPYRVVNAGRFAESIKKAIKHEEVRNIKFPIGSVDQFIDCTDLSDNIKLTGLLTILYK
jgi:hypothetical protein